VLWPQTDFAAWSGLPVNFRSRDIDELIPKDTSSPKTQGKVIHQPLAVKYEGRVSSKNARSPTFVLRRSQ